MTIPRLTLVALAVCLVVAAEPVKVIGITDSDTIRALQDGVSERIRLWAIDSPESAQAFGARAKQFTSSLAFGKLVTRVVKDTDRYDRAGWPASPHVFYWPFGDILSSA